MIQFSQPPTGAQYTEVQLELSQRYPAGRFVAVEGGVVVADAENHRQLVNQLQLQGKSPKDLLIFQAGVEYPTSAVIFAAIVVGTLHA